MLLTMQPDSYQTLGLSNYLLTECRSGLVWILWSNIQ